MQIKLDEKYYLIADKENYMIAHDKVGKDGKIKRVVDGYFSKLHHAFDYFKDLSVRLSDSKTFGEVKALLVDLNRTFSKIETQLYG